MGKNLHELGRKVQQIAEAITVENQFKMACKANVDMVANITGINVSHGQLQINPLPILGIPRVNVNLLDVREVFSAPGIPDVLHIFNAYVQNELPTYLIYVPDKRLLSRDEVKRKFHRNVTSITEEAIHSRLVELKEADPRAEREDAIKDIVKNILQYAILSHRWHVRGEPTFNNIRGSVKPHGYDKLVKFCQKADELGCQLAWSDTCCINKDSSTELEEAIRSMFKWYRNAHICIAYLADITSMDNLHEDLWFTRGWTLQELLAPRRMKFYGSNWQPLTSDVNDKENVELMALISCVTRIPLDDLRDFQPGTNNVHQKMMWASTRSTTRTEDVAYSLIGIFDVTMMIAYGEGNKAFYRLMEVIFKKCVEWQIFAWAGPSSSSSAAFPDSPRCYIPLDPVPSVDAPLPHAVWRGDKNIVMTKHGLEMKVLLVDLSHQEAMVYEKNGTMGFWTYENSRYIAGVVDYWCYDASGYGVLRPEQGHLCVLLDRDPHNPYYSGLRKVTTNNLVIIHARSVLWRALTTVWL